MSTIWVKPGEQIDFAVALHQMNGALLAELMAIRECDSDQELFDAYAAAHAVRYGSPFEPCNCCKSGRVRPAETLAMPELTDGHVRMPEGRPGLRLQSDNDGAQRMDAETEAAA